MGPNGQSDADATTTTVAMLRMISGFWLSRALYAAAKLGLADLLKDGSRTVGDLAQLSGTHAPSLLRMLRALASVGVFSEMPDGRFSSTPLSSTLETNAPSSLRGYQDRRNRVRPSVRDERVAVSVVQGHYRR